MEIRITKKDGNICEWPNDSFTDYEYRKEVFVVIREMQWVGIYNMDCIDCIEVFEV